jgi:hypothetical protein
MSGLCLDTPIHLELIVQMKAKLVVNVQLGKGDYVKLNEPFSDQYFNVMSVEFVQPRQVTQKLVFRSLEKRFNYFND